MEFRLAQLSQDLTDHFRCNCFYPNNECQVRNKALFEQNFHCVTVKAPPDSIVCYNQTFTAAILVIEASTQTKTRDMLVPSMLHGQQVADIPQDCSLCVSVFSTSCLYKVFSGRSYACMHVCMSLVVTFFG